MESKSFLTAHAFTSKWEGGISDHPNDRGGITAYGASIEFVRDIASTSSGRNFLYAIGVPIPVNRDVIRNLNHGQVRAMFKRQFWDLLKLDLIPCRQAVILYDAAVNHGPKQGLKLSQRGFNACAVKARQIVVDGIMGPKTRAALSEDTDCVSRRILEARRDFFHAIVTKDQSQKVFLKGWLNRVNDLEKYVAEMAR